MGYPGDVRVAPLPPTLASLSEVADPTLCVATPCVFDLSKDPAEVHDLAASEPALVPRSTQQESSRV